MGYPSARDETQMLRLHGVDPPVLRAVLNPQDALALQGICGRIHVEDDLFEYAVALASYTRNHARVALGASPRATLAMVQAAKACALLAGRHFMVPDDIRAMAPHVLAHRLVLTADAEPDPGARAQVVEEALSKVGYRRAARA